MKCVGCNENPAMDGFNLCEPCFDHFCDFCPDDSIPSLADLDRYDSDPEPRGPLDAEFPEDGDEGFCPDELQPEPEGGYSDYEDVGYFYMGDE